MEGKRHCKDEQLQLDKISALPQPILETILCFLPTKQAARTSILSREWRYIWTKISKLEFDLSEVSSEEVDVSSEEVDVSSEEASDVLSEEASNVSSEEASDVSSEEASESCEEKSFNDLLQILLSHQGQIQEFTLDLDVGYDSSGLDQILLHLSKNHRVKKLTLYEFYGSRLHELPISLCSLHHLTDLMLSGFVFDNEQSFNSFGSLESLVLNCIVIPSKSLVHLLSNCPSLKRLELYICGSHLGDRDCNVIQLFECLPKVEHLTMNGHDLKLQWPLIDSVSQKLPALFNLKYFCFKDMCFIGDHGLASLLVLIRCSPNLEKIKLAIGGYICNEEHSIVWEEYSDVWLEHLNELEIKFFKNTNPTMEFVKFILARSTKLKKVSIIISLPFLEQKRKILEELLKAPRASSLVNIIVE